MKNFQELEPTQYALEEDLEILSSNNFLVKNLLEKYSFYPTLLLSKYEFKNFYFRDYIVQKIIFELLQCGKYYHEFPQELDDSLFKKLENFVGEIMTKYLLEGKACRF